MTGIVAVIIKLMPKSPETNLEEIKVASKLSLEREGAQNISFSEEEIAFGIKAINIKFAWPEEKDTDIIENMLAKVQGVSSVKIEDYRRAFG